MKRLIGILVLMGIGLGAHAVPITGLYNTGVNDLGLALGGGADDTHYSVAGAPAKTVDPIPGVWFPNTLTSRWIWKESNGQPSGPHSFTTSFDLSGLDPATASISGLWATDNLGGIRINGISSFQSCGGFQSLCAFSIISGFQAGLNTLSFDVTDLGSPGGLLIADISGTAEFLDQCRYDLNCEEEPPTSSINEPGTLGLLALGWLGLAWGRKRTA